MPTAKKTKAKPSISKTAEKQVKDDDISILDPEDPDTDDIDPGDDDDDTIIEVDDTSKPGGGKAQQQSKELTAQQKEDDAKKREKEIAEAQAELEALDPWTEPRRWVIGKPPEHGGKEDEYSIYVQDTLPWMARARFFALVAKTFSDAIKESGGSVGGFGDVFADDGGGGSLIERGRRLTQRDFTDISQFMSLAFDLVAYSPDFLLKCYVIWLDVPREERGWAMKRFNEPWKPDEKKWGLKDEDYRELAQTFIDQNYEEIRAFFVEELPAIAKRVALHEKKKERTALASKSDQ